MYSSQYTANCLYIRRVCIETSLYQACLYRNCLFIGCVCIETSISGRSNLSDVPFLPANSAYKYLSIRLSGRIYRIEYLLYDFEILFKFETVDRKNVSDRYFSNRYTVQLVQPVWLQKSRSFGRLYFFISSWSLAPTTWSWNSDSSSHCYSVVFSKPNFLVIISSS